MTDQLSNTVSDANLNKDQEDARPWYKEPLMWMVVGIPLITIAWGGVMLTLALSSKDSLVSDSYYKDGMSYTENRAFDQRAARLQVRASLVATADELRVSLEGYFDEMPHTLIVQLIHPTLEDRDQTLMLQQLEPGIYAAPLELALPSKRRIWLQSPEQGWRVRTSTTIAENQVLQLIAE